MRELHCVGARAEEDGLLRADVGHPPAAAPGGGDDEDGLGQYGSGHERTSCPDRVFQATRTKPRASSMRTSPGDIAIAIARA